ncbi:hypothetical protein TcBrA4_0055910 [Trypanosoma cruzi]|nr:hypothetical protein TcBrA4_0055910 [Trypanosoma cruzi]
MSIPDVDTCAIREASNDEVFPVEHNCARRQGERQEEPEKVMPRRRGLTDDERRASLIIVGCFLFQEVHCNALRALLFASITAYTLSKYLGKTPDASACSNPK